MATETAAGMQVSSRGVDKTMNEYAIGQDGRLTTVGAQSTNGLSPIATDTGLTVIRSFLSAAEIDSIFKEVGALAFEPAKLGGGQGGVVKAEVRKSMTAWLPANSLPGLTFAGAVRAVAGGPIHNWDTVQVACYQPDMYFEWHVDAGVSKGDYDWRLWTAVAELQSAPGGGLEIEGTAPLALSSGDLAIFPSRTHHRATAPTSGIRFSLTAWYW